MKKYALEISESQLRILTTATELLARIGIGQIEEIVQHFWPKEYYTAAAMPEEIRESLNTLKKHAFGFQQGASYSIHNDKVPPTYREAYDLYQVLRHKLAMDSNPKGDSVWHREPSPASDSQLATISTKE